jgi:ABC-type dipeptide/oligopeptide/nickel transport system permease component
MGMLAYLLRRALTLLFVLFGLAVLIFIIARIVPGDPARIALGPLATATQVTELREEMGLNASFPVQLWSYLSGLAQGDLGKSLLTSRPVMEDIRGALPATFELVLVTIVLQIVVSIPLGVMAAIYRNMWVDNVLRVVSLIGVVTPGFVLAIMLQLIAAHYLGFLPITGRLDGGIDFNADITGLLLIDGTLKGRFDVVLDAMRHLFLPAIALSAAGIGQVMRITRTAMIEVASRDFVEATRAYGIPERVVTFRYMLRVASVAPLTILGLEFASLIGNAFIVEFVFSWPGIASYGVRTIMQKDLNAVIGVVLVSGVFFVVANLTIDLVLGLLDPRHRLRAERET